MTTPEFNLRNTILQVLAESDATEPGDVADLVLRRIKPKDYRAALAQCLRQVVRQTISADRMSKPEPTLEESGGCATPSRSWKVAGIRSEWRAFMCDRVNVGDSWKFLGDCTVVDLMVLVECRRDLATRNLARADQYEALAKLLADHGVDHVSELPASVQHLPSAS